MLGEATCEGKALIQVELNVLNVVRKFAQKLKEWPNVEIPMTKVMILE